jgi:hypothetical protein
MSTRNPNAISKTTRSPNEFIYKPTWASLFRYKLISIITYGMILSIVVLTPFFVLPTYGTSLLNWIVHLSVLSIFIFSLMLFYLRYNRYVFTLYIDGFYYSQNVFTDWIVRRERYIKKSDIASIEIMTDDRLGDQRITIRIQLSDNKYIDLNEEDLDDPNILLSWYYR